MKPVIVANKDIEKAIQSGHSFIQVGDRKFLLMEVEEVDEGDCYKVTDPEEEKQLMAALENDNPIMTDEEINKMLGH